MHLVEPNPFKNARKSQNELIHIPTRPFSLYAQIGI